MHFINLYTATSFGSLALGLFSLIIVIKSTEPAALLYIFIAALSTNKIPAMNVDVLIIPTQTCFTLEIVWRLNNSAPGKNRRLVL